MNEQDIYKIALLRCPACERSFESEIECLQPCKAGDLVLDSCPRCGFLGDFKILSFLLFLLFFASVSWGACTTKTGSWTGSLCHNGEAGNPQCTSTSACDGTGNFFTTSCNDGTYSNLSYARITSIGGVCATTGYGRPVYYYEMLCCTSSFEADSSFCALFPDADGCAPSCDSTQWNCTTTTEHSQTTIANDNIQCFGGDCFGGVYCEYISESITECRNDCGQITRQTSSVPIRYEGACNPDNLTDDTECTNVRCMSFNETKSYTLYKLCSSREIINGERKFFPRMVGGGQGTCKNSGYPESNDSTTFSGSSDSASVPESCFTMGIGCPSADTTNYNEQSNRNPDNCKCEKLDGMSYISRIVCPDGSASAFYGSCDEWRASANSSSSTLPESSSSGSENPQSSSGGEVVGNWTTYEQGEDIKGILGVIAMNTAKEQQINNVNTINVALDDYTTSSVDSTPSMIIPDSIFDPSMIIDTAGLREAIFHRVTDTNSILDTLPVTAGVCPCFTFFSGNGSSSSFSNGHLRFQEIKFDFSDFHGFNLCSVISVIVSAFASIVAFFIGFAIFKNVSQ